MVTSYNAAGMRLTNADVFPRSVDTEQFIVLTRTIGRELATQKPTRQRITLHKVVDNFGPVSFSVWELVAEAYATRIAASAAEQANPL